MAVTVTHAFASAIADDAAAAAAGEVLPSHWNATHTVADNSIYDAQAYGWLPNGTDMSTQALALLTTVSAAGGGTIYFPPSTGKYRADSQLLIPNTGATIPEQVNIRLTGAGGGAIWGNGARTSVGASVLDLRYVPGAQDGNAKIETRGTGGLTIDNLTIVDGGASNPTPFIHATNTTLTIRGNTFLGSGSATQDAIVLGGASNQTAGNGVTAPFQGYGTVIDANHFRSLNRMVYGRTYSNSVVVTNNSFLAPTGTRAIEFAATTGDPPDAITGLTVTGNIIEMSSPMIYGIVLQGVRQSYFANSFYDAGGAYVSDYRFVAATLSSTFYNTIVAMLDGGTPITQTGDTLQLTLNARISSVARTNTQADGVSASLLCDGLELTGQYLTANAAAGVLTIRDKFNLDQLLNLGPLYIDSWDNGGFHLPLTIQQRQGPTTIGGTLALRPAAVTLANGLNSNIGLWSFDAFSKGSYLRLSGPTGAFSVGGFSNKSGVATSTAGSVLTIYNSTAQTMTIVNEDASSTAANRIKTLTGGNVVLRATAPSSASFIYDDTDLRWILTATN